MEKPWNMERQFYQKEREEGNVVSSPTNTGGGFGREEILNVHCSACGKRLYFAQTNR